MQTIRLINPNYHVILVHFPLALLSLGLLIEIFSFLWRGSSARVAGRWMILLGALLTIPAVTSGMYAKANVLQNMNGGSGNWVDVRSGAGLSAEQWKLLNGHVLWESIACIIAVVAVILWMGGTDRWRRKFYFPALLLLILAMAIMTVGSYNAGEMIYSTQFATMGEKDAASQYLDLHQQLADAKKSGNIIDQHTLYLDYYVDPLQVHVIIAGFLFAMAAGALGMSLRKVALAEEESRTQIAALKAAPPVPAGAAAPSGLPPSQQASIRQAMLNSAPSPAPPRPAASRFWLVVALLALLALASGWFQIEYDHSDYNFLNFTAIFKDQILPIARNHFRMIAHLCFGGSLLILALALAAVSRTRSRTAVWLLGLLMIAAVAAQIWVGILMLYDTDTGPITHFNPPGVVN
ncbi:MAG TPA: hypothetical protein VMD30_00010 [Tepidisphaeraceae bacterium]|nr:hypothetical protein [Tepidisphaeraceae bacterium]